ncbi:Glycoside Hydrolase Family 28 protein [Tuber magnatum]|uniref:endo-polygalacturonase n=1 Tax=Tuber magnatum TaxID=42249 RepID=A0A317SF82_9PEZI|nr:Glycoside Hydrolase Family 28 protein [Tuber magnatum]
MLGLVFLTIFVSLNPSPTSPSSSSCTVTSIEDLAEATKNCKDISIGSLTVPAGKTLDLTSLQAGTTVTFTGVVSFGYKEWTGPLVDVGGTNIKIVGASGSVLDGDGARWWDTKGGNGGKKKPKFFAAHGLKSSTITGITLKNTPVQAFSISGVSDLTVSGITVDNKDGDVDELGHNTDAFDVGSSDNVVITGATVYNQDDCLAVNSGRNIRFADCFCSGGHGVSIGSVGGRSDNEVNGVTVENTSIVDSDNGIRIKTISGATGSVKNVKYSGITLKNIKKNGIIIQQDYQNGKPTGTPTDGVPITDLTISDVKGTVDSSATEIYILCAKGACSNWSWSRVDISGGESSLKCQNVPDGVAC